MPSISKNINQQKRRIKTTKKINLLKTFLLTHLVESTNLLFTRLIKKTKTTKKVFDAIIDKNRVKAKTPL